MEGRQAFSFGLFSDLALSCFGTRNGESTLARLERSGGPTALAEPDEEAGQTRSTSTAAPPTPPKAESKVPRLPTPPGKTIDIDRLLEYWRGLPAVAKERLVGYLYRRWPIIKT